MMIILLGIIMVLGWLLSVGADLWITVAAFRNSMVWGFCYLLLPVARPIFVFTHWDQCWRPLLVSLFGFATAAAAMLATPHQLAEDPEGWLELMASHGLELPALPPSFTNRVTKAEIEDETEVDTTVAVGDSCAEVLEKSGKPMGKGSGKGGVVWHYADRTVTFADGKTVSLIEQAGRAAP